MAVIVGAIYAKSVIKRVESRPRQSLEFAAPAGKFEKKQQDSKCTKALRLRRQRVKGGYTGR